MTNEENVELGENQTNNEELSENTVDYKDMYIRLLADYQNLQKRHAETLSETEKRFKFKANENLINVYNDAHLASNGDGISEETKSGIIAFMNKIESILNSENIFKMNMDKYDVDNHEVVATLNIGSTNIVSIVKYGWMCGDTILSYPQVVLG